MFKIGTFHNCPGIRVSINCNMQRGVERTVDFLEKEIEHQARPRPWKKGLKTVLSPSFSTRRYEYLLPRIVLPRRRAIVFDENVLASDVWKEAGC
jgi:hypothetical protein